MRTDQPAPRTIDEYIAGFPPDVQEILEKIRMTIKEAGPEVEFEEELSKYKGGKGTVQFPLDKPIPYDLITRIVKFRVKENLERAAGKTKT